MLREDEVSFSRETDLSALDMPVGSQSLSSAGSFGNGSLRSISEADRHQCNPACQCHFSRSRHQVEHGNYICDS